MSELITTQNQSRETRWHLLSTVSSLAFAITFCTPAQAANDTDRPTVWIELGAQLERVQGGEDPFLPSFLSANPRPFAPVPSAVTQRAPRFAMGGEGKITLAPEGSDWSVSAGIRYGRSNGKKHLHQQTTEVRQSGKVLIGDDPFFAHLTRFGDTASSHKRSYLIADFKAGRDVGLGMWGGKSSAIVDFGVRFAQFTSSSSTSLKELPDPFYQRVPQLPSPFFNKYKTYAHHHSYFGQNDVKRSFSGLGPTISLSGAQALAGNVDETGLSFDWGVNAALLFGRQKVTGDQEIRGRYFSGRAIDAPPTKTDLETHKLDRSKSRIVPNLGGFAGASLRFPNAKVSFGYRADFFFGAMDGGLIKADTRTQGFHGPFATVSVGL